MSDEYISREAALKDFEANNARNPNWTPQRVKTLLLRQPAADVADVVHGMPVTEVRTRTIVGYHEEIGVFAADGSNLYRKNMVHVDMITARLAERYCAHGGIISAGNAGRGWTKGVTEMPEEHISRKAAARILGDTFGVDVVRKLH